MSSYRKKLGFGVSRRSPSPDPRYQTARAHLREDEPDEAMAVLETVEDSQRGHEWHFLQGCALREKGYYVDSICHLDQAYAARPDLEEYWNAQRATHADAAWVKAERRRRRQENEMECCCECCATGTCECCCESLCDGCG